MTNVQDRVWVIFANSTHAQIYRSPDVTFKKLVPVREFVNPDGRLHNAEVSDFTYGRVRNKEYPRSKGLGPKSSPHEDIRKSFAREIAEYLEKCRGNNEFEKIMIVAPPQFLGDLRSFLSKSTRALLWNEIAKELNFKRKEQYIDYLHRHL